MRRSPHTSECEGSPSTSRLILCLLSTLRSCSLLFAPTGLLPFIGSFSSSLPSLHTALPQSLRPSLRPQRPLPNCFVPTSYFAFLCHAHFTPLGYNSNTSLRSPGRLSSASFLPEQHLTAATVVLQRLREQLLDQRVQTIVFHRSSRQRRRIPSGINTHFRERREPHILTRHTLLRPSGLATGSKPPTTLTVVPLAQRSLRFPGLQLGHPILQTRTPNPEYLVFGPQRQRSQHLSSVLGLPQLPRLQPRLNTNIAFRAVVNRSRAATAPLKEAVSRQARVVNRSRTTDDLFCPSLTLRKAIPISRTIDFAKRIQFDRCLHIVHT
jgi:hypothetical protein